MSLKQNFQNKSDQQTEMPSSENSKLTDSLNDFLAKSRSLYNNKSKYRHKTILK